MINLTNEQLEEKINEYTEEQISTELTRSIQQLDKLLSLKNKNNLEQPIFSEQLVLNADMNKIYENNNSVESTQFSDIDLIVSLETYKTIVDENFTYYNERKEILIKHLAFVNEVESLVHGV